MNLLFSERTCACCYRELIRGTVSGHCWGTVRALSGHCHMRAKTLVRDCAYLCVSVCVSVCLRVCVTVWGTEAWPRHLAPHFFLICGTGKFHQEKQTFNTALLFDGPKIKTSQNIPSPFSCKLYGWISKGKSCKGLRWGNGTAPLCSPTSKLESTSRANRNEVSIMFWRVVDKRKILTTVRWSKFWGTLSNTTFLKTTQKIWPRHLEGQPFFSWALGICM